MEERFEGKLEIGESYRIWEKKARGNKVDGARVMWRPRGMKRRGEVKM